MILTGLMKQYIFAISSFLIVYFLGRLVRFFLMNRFRRFAEKTKWKGDDILIESFNRYFMWFVVLLALFIADKFLIYNVNYKIVVSKVLLVLVILTFTLMLARIAAEAVSVSAGKARGMETSSSILRNISFAIVFLIGASIIMNTLGISVAPIITALGIGGLAVALALQNTLSNLFAGLHIIASHDLNPGNFIKLEGGEEGYIVDIKWRNTSIQTLSNSIIVVPNAKLADMKVVNLSLPDKEVGITIDIGVAYGSNLEKVEQVTVQVATIVMQNTEGAIKDFKPFIMFNAFRDFTINFTVIMRAKEITSQYLIKHEFLKLLYKRYEENGIVIPFPERTIHLANDFKLKEQLLFNENS